MRYAQSYAAHREGLMALFGSLNRARLGLGDMPAPAAPPPNPLSDNVLARLYDTQPAQSAPSVSPELEQSLAQKATVQPLEVNTPKRSEEHTSELQSLMRISYAVFCLKKKNTS